MSLAAKNFWKAEMKSPPTCMQHWACFPCNLEVRQLNQQCPQPLESSRYKAECTGLRKSHPHLHSPQSGFFMALQACSPGKLYLSPHLSSEGTDSRSVDLEQASWLPLCTNGEWGLTHQTVPNSNKTPVLQRVILLLFLVSFVLQCFYLTLCSSWINGE